jgi:hypothetical protein
MKALKHVLIGVAIAGIVVGLTAAAFAEKEHSGADIKLLKDSAAALQQSHPDLAKGLTDYANREETTEPKTESLRGILESVSSQKQEMVVNGVAVKIAENTKLEGESSRGQVMQLTLNNMLSYVGRTAKCYGTKTGPTEFTATKVRVYETH